MSRYYKVSITVYRITQKEKASVIDMLDQEGVNILSEYADDLSTAFEGDITLCDGETEEEAHKRLVDMVGKPLDTKWLCLENIQWDEEFYTDTEGLEDSSTAVGVLAPGPNTVEESKE